MTIDMGQWKPKSQIVEKGIKEKQDEFLAKIKPPNPWDVAGQFGTWIDKILASRFSYPWTRKAQEKIPPFEMAKPSLAESFPSGVIPRTDRPMRAYEEWQAPWGVKGGMEFALGAAATGGVSGGGRKVAGEAAEQIAKKVPKVVEEFAGNIRLSKFPEWIRPEIKTFAEQNPALIQSARRGVVPDVKVAEEAQKLAEEVGAIGRKVAKWKAGQAWNAEEILALRSSLRTKVNEIQDIRTVISAGNDSAENLVRLEKSLIDHAELQRTVSGVTAEAGRSLRQFRQQTLDVLANPNAEKLEAILKYLGGRGKVKEIADKLGKLDLDNPNAVNSFIRSVVKPKLNNWLIELFYGGLVMNPATQLINFTSNFVNTILSPVERLGAATIEAVAAPAFGRARGRFFGEVASEAYGFVRGIPEGVRKATQIIKTGQAVESTKWEIPAMQAIPGVAGKVARAGLTGLEAADAFFYGILRTMGLRSMAYREAAKSGLRGGVFAKKVADLIQNPTEAVLKNAHSWAEYRLFRQPLKSFGKGVIRVRDAEIANLQPLRFIVPFVRTPMNLVKYGMERSPIGILNPSLWGNVLRNSPEMSDNMVRWVMGSGISAAIASYFTQDMITSAPPTNKAERDRFYREGKLPYAVKIGNHWVQYSRLEPFNTPIAMVAAVVDAIKNKEPDAKIQDLVWRAISSVGKDIADQPYLTGIGNIINAMEDPERYTEAWLYRSIGGFVPASSFTRMGERIVSPEVEDPDNIIQAVQANIPFASTFVPKKLTAFGEPVRRQSNVWSPIQITKEVSNPLVNELERLQVNVGFVGKEIWGIELSDTEARQYQNVAGMIAKKAIEGEMATATYKAKTTSDGWRKERLGNVASQAQTQARNQMLDRLYREGKIVGDKKLVYEYQMVLRKIPPEYQAQFGSNIREARPEIDVALNLEGVASSVKSQEALVLLIEEARKRGIPPETLPAVKALAKQAVK